MTEENNFTYIEQPYYLVNFHTMMQWLEQRYGDLLLPQEQEFLALFMRLPVPAQCLLVRMLMRTKLHFRLSKLNYPEVGDLSTALAMLQQHQFITLNPMVDIRVVLEQLLKAELIRCFADDVGTGCDNKKAICDRLTEIYAEQAQDWDKWTADIDDTLIQLECQAIFDALCLMFFGNPYQNLSEFVLTDLGLFVYEKIPFDDHTRAFQTRQQVDFYLQLLISRESLRQGLSEQALVELPAATDAEWLNQKRNKTLYHIGYEFERSGQFDRATYCYLDNSYSRARERYIRVLEKQQQYELAFDLCSQALAVPRDEQEKQGCEKLIKRLARKTDRKIAISANRTDIEQLVCQLPYDDHAVELIAADCLTEGDELACYVENALFNSLFGMTFWDAVFKPCPGAFFHPFQSAPHDLYASDFASTRAAEIVEAWSRLEQPEYFLWLSERYRQKQGIANPFVSWQVINESLLSLVEKCIPIDHLKAIFKRLLFDMKNNRSGFPDLIVFDPQRCRYRLVEVKGPGDRLQDNQIRWFGYFSEHQIPASVMYIQWQDHADN